MASDQSAGDTPNPKVCQHPLQPAVPAGPAVPQEELKGDNRLIWAVLHRGHALKIFSSNSLGGHTVQNPGVCYSDLQALCRVINHCLNSNHGCCNHMIFAKLPNLFSRYCMEFYKLM